jgi:hypothetical protein
LRIVTLNGNKIEATDATQSVNLNGTGSRESLPQARCEILTRFIDDQEKAIAGVSLRPPPTGSGSRQSDEFGRILVWIPFRQELSIVAQREGYDPETIELKCMTKPFKDERVIVLHHFQR